MIPRFGAWSISLRLALWYAVSILVLLTGFAVFSYVTFHGSLHRDFDRHLLHELRALLPLVEYGDDGPEFRRFEAMRTVAYQTDGIFGTYVRLLDAEGNVLYRSPNLEGHSPLEVALPEEPVASVEAREWKDGPIRSHYHPLFGPDGQLVGWLEVSGFEWSLHQELERLGRTFTAGILFSVILALGGGHALARRSLRPVAQITGVANDIQASRLDRRIPVDLGVQDELTRLATTINELLDRIQDSFQRERRFSANAAHELVTPLATIRGEIELALKEPELSSDLQTRLLIALEDTDRMNRIIRSLLQISSAERIYGRVLVSRDLRGLVADHVARFADRAQVEGKTISTVLGRGCTARIDEEGFGLVVDNLLDNALKYSEEGDSVRVRLWRDDGQIRLSVSDDGIGFDPADSAHLFDRFFRSNTHATKVREGSGLGLAIVAAVMEAHNGDVEASSHGPGRGSRFQVSVPAA